MKTVKKDGLSLYIHIPFCVKKCLYCDFLSFSASNSKKQGYVKALVNELAAWEEVLKEKLTGMDRLYFKTVFAGGGTPTCLEPSMLLEILQSVMKYTDENTEFTIEANPGTITDSHISVFKETGINRVSLGLQSAQDRELKKLGRIHTYREFCNSYNKLQKAGFGNINIDIMAGIPGQDIPSYKDTLEKVAALAPAHISVYSLIVEPGTEFYKMQEQGGLDIADEDTDRHMYNLAKEILGRNGYNRYEISNYSKKGMECLHNITYWTGGSYLGTGLGASSYINGTRFTGTMDFNKYTCIFKDRAGQGMAENQVQKNIGTNYENLSVKNQMEEFMFLGLRLTQGISVNDFEKKFHTPYVSVYGKISRELEEKKLLRRENGRIFLTERGIDLSNYVLSEFLLSE